MKKNNSKGILSGILGTILVILGVVAYAIVSSLICGALIKAKFGGEIACAILTLTPVGLGVAFVLYEAAFIMWQYKLSKESSKNGDEGEKAAKLFRLVLVGAICLSLLFALVSANVYTRLGEDSISKVVFVSTKEYRWDERCDVLRYTFSCDENGGLTFNVTMKDGEVVEILGAQTSLSDGFKEKYATDRVNLLQYVAELSEQFDSCEFIIDKKVVGAEFMEKYYKTEGSEIWAQIERIIASEVGQPTE
ncbi:MAG: hypothetical protein IJY39_00965 [Clostridia bacterium]|nr:hypothetical protein [Clostridia bacterium]